MHADNEGGMKGAETGMGEKRGQGTSLTDWLDSRSAARFGLSRCKARICGTLANRISSSYHSDGFPMTVPGVYLLPFPSP